MKTYNSTQNYRNLFSEKQMQQTNGSPAMKGSRRSGVFDGGSERVTEGVDFLDTPYTSRLPQFFPWNDIDTLLYCYTRRQGL